MHATHPRVAWLFFTASILSAGLFASFAWMLSWYVMGMLSLLLVTIGASAWVLSRTPRTLRVFTIVGIGLIIGNWALIKMVAMVAIWSKGGFAP